MEQEFKIEKRSQLTCLSCKKIAKHCKCKTPDHKMVETEYKTAINTGENHDGAGQRSFASEADRIESIARRFAEKEEKRKQRLHLSEEMSMDPEELEEKKVQEDRQKRTVIKAIENEAKDFVDQIDAKKAELEAAGKSPREVMHAIKALKRELRGAAIAGEQQEEEVGGGSEEDSESHEKEEKANFTIDDLEEDEGSEGEELTSPVKDAVTGKFIDASESKPAEQTAQKRGRKAAKKQD